MSARQPSTLSLIVASICVLSCASANAQPVLTIEGSCPGPMRAEVRGARPERSFLLLFSPNEGSTRLPKFHWCGGAMLGLDRRGLMIVSGAIADENGFAVIEGEVGLRACGGFLQTLNWPDGGCETSNVVQIP